MLSALGLARAIEDGELTPAHLRMAEIPDGSEPLFVGFIKFPIVRIENIYVLPGIPEIFREKFVALKDVFAGEPYFLRVLYLQVAESSIAPPGSQ